MVIQQYNTPRRAKTPSYCSPKDYLNEVVPEPQNENSIFKPKPPTNVGIKLYPKQKHPVKGEHVNVVQHQFCDTLGPSVCHSCIEGTNRKIAQDVEQSSFPELECSATTLVAPKLAMIMMDSDRFKMPSEESRVLLSRGSSVMLPPVNTSKTKSVFRVSSSYSSSPVKTSMNSRDARGRVLDSSVRVSSSPRVERKLTNRSKSMHRNRSNYISYKAPISFVFEPRNMLNLGARNSRLNRTMPSHYRCHGKKATSVV